jgi:hypothetical protein
MIKLASESPSNMDDYKKQLLESTLVKLNPESSQKKSATDTPPKSANTVKPTLRLPARAEQKTE